MKLVYAELTILLIGVFLGVAGVVHAQWSALGSGYAVTTNWHGDNVPIGQNVTVWAGTTDPEVEEVLFRWNKPGDAGVWLEITVDIVDIGPYTTPEIPAGVPEEISDWAEDHQGITIYYATDTQSPEILGDWGVQALFIGEGGVTKANHNDVIMIRSSSFNTIPDFPLIGTAGALISMLLGLSLFLRKKKQ